MEQTPELSRLFQLIVKEEVVLFAGAGLSLYAGYPSGNALKDQLFASLTDEEKDEVDIHSTLSKLATDIFYLHKSNRRHLIRFLKDIFDREPSNLTVHEKISKIPHFSKIITTNYDRLFEKAYGDKLDVIFKASHLSYTSEDRPQLYKIHGDLVDGDTIILSDQDYTSFFSDANQNSTFWTTIKHLMTTKHLLFIGYSLADENIESIFERITKELGGDYREAFFISPSITKINLCKLGQKKISYIKATGEEFIDSLHRYLEDNIVHLLQKGDGKSTSVQRFMHHHGFDISTGINKAAQFYICSIESHTGQHDHKLTFKTVADTKFVRSLQDYLQNRTLDDQFIIPATKLQELSAYFGKVKVSDLESSKSLILTRLPTYEGTIDISLEDGFEISNLRVKVYKAFVGEQVKMSVENEVEKVVLTFSFNKKALNLKYDSTLNKTIPSVSLALQYYLCLHKISSAVPFEIYEGTEQIFKEKFKDINDHYFSDMVKLFEKLKKIERFYKIKFIDFPSFSIDDKLRANVNMLCAKIDKKFLKVPCDILTAELIESTDKGILQFNKDQNLIMVYFKEILSVSIFDHTFELGYQQIYIDDAFITNFSEIKNGVTTNALIKSRSGIMRVGFSDLSIV